MIPGIEVDLSGTTYVVPPLRLGDMERFQTRLSEWTGGTDPKSVGTVLDVVLAALQRNYPELTRDQIADVIDLGNMLDVMAAVADIGGLKRKAIAEEKLKASNP